MAKKPHLLIVEARFYDHLADALLEGAVRAVGEAGATYDLVTVPGALEIPGVIANASAQAKRADGNPLYDAYVALGCVIRGETYHFDIVANESCRGVMDLTIHHHLAIGNGILTVDNEAQALVRAKRNELDKGGFAVQAALTMLDIKKRFGAAT